MYVCLLSRQTSPLVARAYVHEAAADISQSVSVHVTNADTVNLGTASGAVSISIIISIISGGRQPD